MFIIGINRGEYMDYTIKQLSELAGISTRTLRYYDQIGLLYPKVINSSGYRIYGTDEVDKLHQILLYRQLDMSLKEIKMLMLNSEYNAIIALQMHQEKLQKQKIYLDLLVKNISLTIQSKKEGIQMKDNQKFKALKDKQLEENDKKYGQEIRIKYGDSIVDESNNKYNKMSEKTYMHAETLSAKIFEYLNKAMDDNDFSTEYGKIVYESHKEWIMIYWNDYSYEAHRQLVDMYVDDDRFRHYYDKERDGTAKFLRDTVYYYTTL